MNKLNKEGEVLLAQEKVQDFRKLKMIIKLKGHPF